MLFQTSGIGQSSHFVRSGRGGGVALVEDVQQMAHRRVRTLFPRLQIVRACNATAEKLLK